MNNSQLTVSSTRSVGEQGTEYRVNLYLNDIVSAKYVVDDHMMMMYQPRASGGGSCGIEQRGLREMVLRQLETEMQEFVRYEIANKFERLRNTIGAAI